MEVRIIRVPEENRMIVDVANDFFLIEGVSTGGEVSVHQFPIIGFNSSVINQDSLILGVGQEAEGSSIEFLKQEMARVKERVPGEIRKQLYDNPFWKNIGSA